RDLARDVLRERRVVQDADLRVVDAHVLTGERGRQLLLQRLDRAGDRADRFLEPALLDVGALGADLPHRDVVERAVEVHQRRDGDPEYGGPSAGGLSAAVGDVEPIDDAEAILAENLAEGDAGEGQAAEFAATPAPAAAGSSGLLARVSGAALLLGGALVAVLEG